MIDQRFADMRSAGRGGLMVMRGDSGVGKSTFLETVGLFRVGVQSVKAPMSADIEEMLPALGRSDGPRVIVVEGREALREESQESLEVALHAINAFVRTEEGSDSLIVWPTNTDDLSERLLAIAAQLGGTALLGPDQSVLKFDGPVRESFIRIAQSTVHALNHGASFATLGLSEDEAEQLARRATTIGEFIGMIRGTLLQKGAHVAQLMERERCRVWTVVVGGEDTGAHVAAITRGNHGHIDMDRLLSATSGNVVRELQRYPDRIGTLGLSLDARILYLEPGTALAVARSHGQPELRALMEAQGLAGTSRNLDRDRESLRSTGLAVLLAANALGNHGVRRVTARKVEEDFKSLVEIARTQDGHLNRALGAAIRAEGLVESFDAEAPFEGELTLASDLRLIRAGEAIRIEMMWRPRATQAAISDYVLRKLHNYGRSIGYLT